MGLPDEIDRFGETRSHTPNRIQEHSVMPNRDPSGGGLLKIVYGVKTQRIN